MKNIFIVALLALAFTGCKDEKKDGNPTQQETPAAENDFFQVTLDVVAKKDDHFHIYYSEDGSINFTEEKSVWSDVKGSETSQKVVFKLPKDAIPTQLRVDFGWTKDQGEIIINSFDMAYYGKNYTIPGADFFKFFRPNEGNTVVNEANHSVKSLPNDGKTGPSAYPMDPLAQEIAKLTGK